MTACREWSSDSGGGSQELRHKRERRSYADLGEKPDPTTAARTKASRERQRRERLNDRSGTYATILRALAKLKTGKRPVTNKATASLDLLPQCDNDTHDHMVTTDLDPIKQPVPVGWSVTSLPTLTILNIYVFNSIMLPPAALWI